MLLFDHVVAHLHGESQLVHVLHHLHLCQVRQILTMKRSLESTEGRDNFCHDCGDVFESHVRSDLGDNRQGRHLRSQVPQLIFPQGQASLLDLNPAEFALFDGGGFFELLVEARLLG